MTFIAFLVKYTGYIHVEMIRFNFNVTKIGFYILSEFYVFFKSEGIRNKIIHIYIETILDFQLYML